MAAGPTLFAPMATSILNMTIIPSHKERRNSRRRATKPSELSSRPTTNDLFTQWKQESVEASSTSATKGMDALLNDLTLDFAQLLALQTHLAAWSPPDYRTDAHSPSIHSAASSESIPSLCHDNWSEPSWGSPTSIASFQSSPLISAVDKPKLRPRSLVLTKPEVSETHPLDSAYVSGEEDVVPDDIALSPPTPSTRSHSRSSGIRPVLTQSLQTLKSRALSSLQSFSLPNRFILPQTQKQANPDSDSLWSHPFLFPRLSSEIRPEPFTETPTESERHYFNPTTPPTLDQQRASFREALHPPKSHDITRNATQLILLEPANSRRPLRRKRVRRASNDGSASTSSATAAPNPSSDPTHPQQIHMRRREPRENSNFLRVVVLEMNMRRHGKLEDDAIGRARIWLPPRASSTSGPCSPLQNEDGSSTGSSVHRRRGSTPARWAGVSASETE